MNPTTQLVEAIEGSLDPLTVKLTANTDNLVRKSKVTRAILRAVADAVDTQIGPDLSKANSIAALNREAGRNDEKRHMRTFTAVLREAAK